MKLFPLEVSHLIKVRAYLIYLNRMDHNLPGDALSDWSTAQAEITENFWTVFDARRGAMYETN